MYVFERYLILARMEVPLILAKCVLKNCCGHFRCMILAVLKNWKMTQFASLPNFKFYQNVLHTYLFKFSSLQLSLRVIFILFTILSCFLKIFENDDLSLHFIFYCFRLLDRNKVQFHGDYLHSTKLNQRVGMKRRISFAIPILILVAINICFNQVIF